MPIKLGSTNFGSIYLGSTKIGEAYLGSVKVYGAQPPAPVLPTKTIRCKFSSGYTPTIGDTQTLVDADENIWDIYKSSTDWSSLLFSTRTYLEDVIAANTTGVTNMRSMFAYCSNLTTVPLFDTSAVTDMGSMFTYCSNLTTVPLFNTSDVTYMGSMFYNCSNLTTVPLFNTSAVTYMNSMFWGCNRNLTTVPLFDTSAVTKMQGMFNGCVNLTEVPLFDTSAATHMSGMFQNCYKVESGALALYQQASTQANPPTDHEVTFENCGRDTVTGAAELLQIPASWGGTGA